MSDILRPKSRAEELALFRAQVIGGLAAREHTHGDLAEELRKLATIPVRPPHATRSRTYAVSTLERWYYDFREHGLDGLMPRPRSDRGFAQSLTQEQRRLLLDIAEEHDDVDASVIFRTLEGQGQLDKARPSDATLRRLLAAHGLGRRSRRQKTDGRARRRWVAAEPGQLWHADVCHGPTLRVDGRSIPLRVHALLDDASRFIVAAEVFSTEREVDMLALMVKALRTQPPPKTLYLDNGSTYRGDALATACGRLNINLLHAQPYDPQARGKMERFWRTLRNGCLDHVARCTSLHDVRVRVLAFLDDHYHRAPHGGLMGQSPADSYAGVRSETPIEESRLRDALTVRERRRVLRDGTVSVGGTDWEVREGYLAGRVVTIARTLFEPDRAPWLEDDDGRHELKPVDPVANGRTRQKAPQKKRGVDAIPFDPAKVHLDRTLGRAPKGETDE